MSGLSLVDLERALRGLLAWEQQVDGDWARHVEACAELAQRIRESAGLPDMMPHEVWHFLADADLRGAEPDYGRAQRKQLLDLLDGWLAPRA